MDEDVYSSELFKVLGRVLGFAISILILAYVFEYLGLSSKYSFIKSILSDTSLIASIAR